MRPTDEKSIVSRLMDVRRPVYRNISHSTLDKTSPLHAHYVLNTLTEEMLRQSQEDAFTVAFYYNEKFDVLDYLRFLKKREIGNVAYNVMKKYLRGCSIEAIDGITTGRHSPFKRACLAVLRGELYRINEYEVSEQLCASELGEYFALGAISIHDQYVENFENVLSLCIKNNRRIINLLDYGNQKVRDALAVDLEHAYDHLLETGLIKHVIGSLDFDNILVARVAGIVNKCGMHELLASIKGIRNFRRLLDVAIAVGENREAFMCLKDIVLDRISERDEARDGEAMSGFVCMVLYYNIQYTSTDWYVCQIMDGIVATKTCSQYIEEIMKGAGFQDMARLFVEYARAMKAGPPAVEDVLCLPERFFLASLDAIGSETAVLLKRFHTNLLHARIKDAVAKAINRSVLVKYLISRNIWYDTDMEDYVPVMSAKYRLMYAAHNLEWASRNIALLREHGIPRSLYSQLKKSAFSGCLAGLEDSIVESSHSEMPANSHPDASEEHCHSEETATESHGITKFAFNASGKKLKLSEEAAAADGPCDGINMRLERIFECLKGNDSSCQEILGSVASDDEYTYIISSLFTWVEESKCLQGLGALLAGTAAGRCLSYGDFKALIAGVARKYDGHSVLRSMVAGVKIGDIKDIIKDYPEQSDAVAEGIAMRIGHSDFSTDLICAKNDLENSQNIISSKNTIAVSHEKDTGAVHELVRELVSSGSNAEAMAGIKAFAFLERPVFTVDHMLASTDDRVLAEVVKHIEHGKHNGAILGIVFTRGVLDELAAELIKLLDVSLISQADLNRIYFLFYVAPVNFIVHGIYKAGFALNDAMATELIVAMETIYDEALFEMLAGFLRGHALAAASHTAMCLRLETKNHLFRRWVLRSMDPAAVTHPFFVKICWVVANEDDLGIVRLGIELLLKHGDGNGIRNMILGWARNRKLERLTRRFYPLCMADRGFYTRLLARCGDGEEVAMLKDVYGLN